MRRLWHAEGIMGRKADLKQVDAVCRRHGMSRDEAFAFRDYLHELKDSGAGGTGPNGDFTEAEPNEAAKDFKNLGRQP
jgi:hypothetical protein